MAELTIAQKKDFAERLFLTEAGITQKEIAQRVGVTEATVSKWIREGNWRKQKDSLLMSKSERLAELYDQLREANADIKNRPEGMRFPSSKESDAIRKITACINDLEIGTNISEKMDVGKQFLAYARQVLPLEQSKEVCRLFDSFIKSCING